MIRATWILAVTIGAGACGGHEPGDGRCQALKDKLASCGLPGVPGGAQCGEGLLLAFDQVMGADCAMLATGKADWLSGTRDCTFGEHECGPFGAFCCGGADQPDQPTAFQCDLADEGSLQVSIYTNACSQEGVQRLQSGTCSALQQLAQKDRLLGRLENNTATEQERQDFALWFSRGSLSADALAGPPHFSAIARTVRDSLTGLKDGQAFHYQCADETQPACNSGPGKRGGVRVESVDPPVFMICPRFFDSQLGDDPATTIIHEATHIFAQTVDHGYMGPCEYMPATVEYDQWFSMLRLTPDQLVENADTYSNWITEYDYSHNNMVAHPADGICPDMP